MSHIRIKPLAFLIAFLVGAYYLAFSSALDLFRITAYPHAGIALSQSDIRDRFYSKKTIEQQQEQQQQQQQQQHPTEPVIPRKIHQIYHDWSSNVPHKEQWMRLRDSCIARNPGWQYKLWSTAESREFIQREYPWFLRTYDNYKYPVQRVDALKYFILRHEGGVYIDMDNGCLESLEPLRVYPLFITDNNVPHNALDNNIMGAVAHHPFFEFVTEHSTIWWYGLFWYPFPYMAVMYNSGQWFLTSMWERYHHHYHHRHYYDPSGSGYRVMMENRRGAEPWVFWNEGAGLTWEDWDYGLFASMGEPERVAKLRAGVAAGVGLLMVVSGWVAWRSLALTALTGSITRKARAALAVLSPGTKVLARYDVKNDHDLV